MKKKMFRCRFTRKALIAVMVMLVLAFSACGKSQFGIIENTGKLMLIHAERADKDAFFMVGSLEVDDGEQITITSDLTKGELKIEIISTPEEQSIDVLPDLDGEPIIMTLLRTTDSVSGTVPAGSYMLKATCLERATGTVVIEVTPAA